MERERQENGKKRKSREVTTGAILMNSNSLSSAYSMKHKYIFLKKINRYFRIFFEKILYLFREYIPNIKTYRMLLTVLECLFYNHILKYQ